MPAQHRIGIECERVPQINFANRHKQPAIGPLEDRMAFGILDDELGGDVRRGCLLLEGGDGTVMDGAAMIEEVEPAAGFPSLWTTLVRGGHSIAARRQMNAWRCQLLRGSISAMVRSSPARLGLIPHRLEALFTIMAGANVEEVLESSRELDH